MTDEAVFTHYAPTLASSFNKGLGTGSSPWRLLHQVVKRVEGSENIASAYYLRNLTREKDENRWLGVARQHLKDRVLAIFGNDPADSNDSAQFAVMDQLGRILLRAQELFGEEELNPKRFIDALLVCLFGEKAQSIIERVEPRFRCPRCRTQRAFMFEGNSNRQRIVCLSCGKRVSITNEAAYRLKGTTLDLDSKYMRMTDQLLDGILRNHMKSQDRNTENSKSGEVVNIPLALIDPPVEPVRSVKISIMQELRNAIQTDGLYHAIIVRPKGDRYEVVAGYHRYTSVKLLCWKTVPCIVRSLSDEEAHLVSIAENIQRNTHLDPIREGEIFSDLTKKGWALQEISRRIGKNPQGKYVETRIRIHQNLHPKLKKQVSAGHLSLQNANALSQHPPQAQLDLANQLKRWPRMHPSHLTTSGTVTSCTHACPEHCLPMST